MASEPPDPPVSPKKPLDPPHTEQPPLPHDLPLFPENAPLDEDGEPIVRP